MSSTVPTRRESLRPARQVFRTHHQPFNYYPAVDPDTDPSACAKHIRDYSDLPKDLDEGPLPSISFYRTKGNILGPGTRIHAIIISLLARHGTVDHTQYDTGSMLRLIIRPFNLPMLRRLSRRDSALVANGMPSMGDLTNALT